MGMPALPLVLTLMAAVPAAPAVPMAELEFQQLLLEGDLIGLEQACRDARDFGLINGCSGCVTVCSDCIRHPRRWSWCLPMPRP